MHFRSTVHSWHWLVGNWGMYSAQGLVWNNTISTAAIIQYQLNYKYGNAKGVRNCFGLFGVMLGFTWRGGENCEGPQITWYLWDYLVSVPGSEPATFRLSVEFSAVSSSLGLRERTIHTIRKGTVVPVHIVNVYRGSRDIAPLVLNLCIRWR